MTRTRDQIEAEMVRVGKEIQAMEARRPSLYAQREALLVEGREVTPPIEHQVSGAHFGIGDKGVMKVLRERKARLEKDGVAS